MRLLVAFKASGRFLWVLLSEAEPIKQQHILTNLPYEQFLTEPVLKYNKTEK
jgi:hypothetical protein